MDIGIKAAWVEALRSGKYEQGKQALRAEGNKFCCLGVLCDVLEPNAWSKNTIKGLNGWRVYSHGGDEFCPARRADLSKKQLAYIKLEHRDMWELIGRNDNGDTFAQIADYIEQTF